MAWLQSFAARCALLAMLGVLTATPAVGQERKPGPIGQPSGPYREQEFFIAWEQRDGKPSRAQAKVFHPESTERRPLALIAHGLPRTGVQRLDWADPQARWFAAQGFVVVVPLRRGFGRSDGPVQETFRSCEQPDFYYAGATTADDIQGILREMAKESYVDATRMIVVGHSAGGWGTLAIASRNLTGVIGIINFAGGRGSLSPGTLCSEPSLIETAGRFGQTARTPSLWIYARNDMYAKPNVAQRMFDAYRAQGAPAALHLAAPFDKDGHFLFTEPTGMSRWIPLVTEFLRKLELMP
jgi:pimeloyl-ACP methyl ester carboxylesterase